MPNLKNAVTKISLNDTDGIKQLRQLEKNIESLEEDLPDEIDKLAKLDADSILRDLLIGYTNYVRDYVPEEDDVSYPVGYVLKTKDGYKASLYGKNLWYYEFGTGDKGANVGYSRKRIMEKAGYKWNEGPTVIHANTYDPDDVYYDGDLPKAYINTINKHPKMAHHNWWVHENSKGPLSNGIPPGNILNGVMDAYIGAMYSDSKTSGKSGITKYNINYVIRNKLLKGMNK